MLRPSFTQFTKCCMKNETLIHVKLIQTKKGAACVDLGVQKSMQKSMSVKVTKHNDVL